LIQHLLGGILGNKMNAPALQKTTIDVSQTILQRIAEKDKTCVNECLDKYGGMVWALSKKFTDSDTEAEVAASQIFADIWNCADCFDPAKNAEKDFILYIVLRNLFGHLLSPEDENLQQKQLQPESQNLSSEAMKGLKTYLYLKKFMRLRSPKL